MEVSAILLAAGLSKRMGQSKPLLPLGDRPVIVHCLECIRSACIADVVVVTRPDDKAVQRAIREFPVKLVMNRIPGSDMAESVKTGLSRVSPAMTGIFVFPCDHPLVTPATLGCMIRAFSGRPGAIIVPRYMGRNGHPTLFPRALLEEIGTNPTLRDIIGKHPDKVYRLDVDDSGIVLDMDTPEDYREVLSRFQNGLNCGSLPPGKDRPNNDRTGGRS